MRRALLAMLPALLVAETPAVTRMRQDLEALASPAFEGRGHVSPGLEQAARYVADQLKKAGLKPEIQRVPVQLPPEKTRATLQVALPGGSPIPLAWGTDVEVLGFTPEARLQDAPLCFAGFGMTLPDKGYDDLAGLDLKGKVAVIGLQPPDKGLFAGMGRMAFRTQDRIGALKAKGAVGVVVLTDPAILGFMGRMGREASPLPVLGMSTKALAPLGDLEARLAAIGTDQKPASGGLPGRLSLDLAMVKKDGSIPNVVARIPGRDPKLAQEHIVLGGHMDHLGTRKGPGGAVEVFFGADDNASGTTVVMELARRLKQKPLKRSAVVVAFSGEESGLFGSAHYAANPTVPAASLKAMLNFDMVGRIAKDRPVAILDGSGSTPQGIARALRLAPPELVVHDDPGLIPGGSDHMNFVAKGIPSLFFFGTMHEDYHRTTDTPDKINYVGMALMADWGERVARDLGDAPQPPAFRKRVAIGLSEDRPVRGYKVARIQPGTTAEALGLKPGDLLQSIGASGIGNGTDLILAFRDLSVGDRVKAVWMREGKRMEATAEVKESRGRF